MTSYCQQLNEQIAEAINNNPLGIDIKFFIVKSLYLEIEKIYTDFLNAREEDLLTEEQLAHRQEVREQAGPHEGKFKTEVEMPIEQFKEVIELAEEKEDKE